MPQRVKLFDDLAHLLGRIAIYHSVWMIAELAIEDHVRDLSLL